MNLRKKGHTDSLELLLNTMCNTFGGIVMISLVMALLSRDATPESIANARAQILRMQLQDAQTALNSARALHDSLAPNAAADSAVFALAEERDRLQSQIKQDRAALESNPIATAEPAPAAESETLQRLRAQQSALSTEAAALLTQLEKVQKTHQRDLRLPRERATGKKPLYFIVRYGRIFPIAIMRNGQRDVNTDSIDWTQSPEGRIAAPRQNIPLSANPPFAQTLREFSADKYSVHFIVYNDSFPVFLSARQIPLQSGYDTGWEFLTEDREVIFSSGGQAPPAL